MFAHSLNVKQFYLTHRWDPTTLGQNEPGSDGNERELRIPQSSNITRTSPSDCHIQDIPWGGKSYLSTKMQQSILLPQPAGPWRIWSIYKSAKQFWVCSFYALFFCCSFFHSTLSITFQPALSLDQYSLKYDDKTCILRCISALIIGLDPFNLHDISWKPIVWKISRVNCKEMF